MTQQHGAGILPVFRGCGYLQGVRETGAHRHVEPQLIALVDGAAVVEADGVSLHLETGALALLPPETDHAFSTQASSRVYYLRFEPGSLLFDFSLRVITFGDDPWVRRWLEDLYGLRRGLADNAVGIADGILYSLLLRIRSLEEQETGPAVHPALRKVMRLIERDIAAPLSVATMAEVGTVSPSYLTALFRQAFGCGPMQYLHSVRMSFATRQLQDPYLTVKEVGYQAGYSDPNYFARVFRRRFGVSPSAFREGARR